MIPPLSKVSSARGAPMGRVAVHALARTSSIKFHLVRVRLVGGCYDEGGAYWGAPSDLWRVRSVGEVDVEPLPYSGVYRARDFVEFFVRAPSRGLAKKTIGAALCEGGFGYRRARFFR